MGDRIPAAQHQPQVEKSALRDDRAVCYKARDAFFKCLEADFGRLTPADPDSVELQYPTRCKPARTFLEQNCRRPWVKHFDRRFYAKWRVRHLSDMDDN